MRPFDRDLIRGGHYGQRSCEPHPKAEHMAAPTNAAFVKKALANWEPSTHGPPCGLPLLRSYFGVIFLPWSSPRTGPPSATPPASQSRQPMIPNIAQRPRG